VTHPPCLSSALCHENLLAIRSWKVDRKERSIWVVTDRMHWDAKQAVQHLSKSNNPVSHAKVLEVAFKAARGVAHLHTRQPPVIHRDLRLVNVLVRFLSPWRL